MSSSATADQLADIQTLDAAMCLLDGAASNPKAALEATFHFLKVRDSPMRMSPAQTVLAVLGELVMEEALKQLAGCTRLNDALLEHSMELASQARREQARKEKGSWDWNAAPKEFTEALSDAVNRALSSTAVPERDRVLWLQFEKAIVGDGPWVPNVQRIAEGAPGRGHVDLRSRRAATFDRGRAVNAADAICIHHRMFPYA